MAPYKWDHARFSSPTETLSDVFKSLKKVAKQAFGNEADRCIRMFLFGKLPVDIQQEGTIANKEDSFPEEIKAYLIRKYQYQQMVTFPTTIQLFNVVISTAKQNEFSKLTTRTLEVR